MCNKREEKNCSVHVKLQAFKTTYIMHSELEE